MERLTIGDGLIRVLQIVVRRHDETIVHRFDRVVFDRRIASIFFVLVVVLVFRFLNDHNEMFFRIFRIVCHDAVHRQHRIIDRHTLTIGFVRPIGPEQLTKEQKDVKRIRSKCLLRTFQRRTTSLDREVLLRETL